jgi:4-hydroxy-tetrahydrodipicolinate reductase
MKLFWKKEENNTFDGLDADVAIDFSVPSAAVLNINNCLNENVPVISGTNG